MSPLMPTWESLVSLFLGVPAPKRPISRYADDTSIIVTDDAIKATFETYSIFERFWLKTKLLLEG